MAPLIPKTLSGELGAPGLASSNGFLETWEATPELQWPNNVIVYDLMRRTDAQIGSLLRAIRLPIVGTRWGLAGDDVAPEVKALVERDLGLDRQDVTKGRRRTRSQGVNWREFLHHVVLGVAYGHMPFEKVYEVGPPPDDIAGTMPEYVAHLAKLSPRMPRSLFGIHVAPSGDLTGIRQWVPVTGPGESSNANRWDYGYIHKIVDIGAERLAFYCHEREGSDWLGNSILREAYKHWLIKDQLIRVDAMSIDRNGMGIPFVKYVTGGNEAEAMAIVKRYRAGDEAGITASEHYDVTLLGTAGTIREALPSIKYHDESAGRAALAMFLNLGHDRGARSLGDTFVDFFTMALNAEIEAIEEFVTEEIIRDLVALNFGDDEPYPELQGDDLTAESMPTAEGLAALFKDGALTHDLDVENDLRRRYGLPLKVAVNMPATGADPLSPDGAATDVKPTDAPPPVDENVNMPAGGGQGPTLASAGQSLAELEARLATAKQRITDREAVAAVP